ncbi:MAG: DUF2294 family protein [Actinobacteria bacterium]|nr:MAG: DUF2294 family protein [Actinomycetota bacterium]
MHPRRNGTGPCLRALRPFVQFWRSRLNRAGLSSDVPGRTARRGRDTRAVTTPSEIDGQVLASVSNAIVRLYKEQFGRGPTRARTEWAGPDQLVVTLEETLTAVERRLVAMGEHQRVRDHRLFFQHASQAEFTTAVEQLTGRRVRAFISGLDSREDLACEVFVLEPEDG